MIRYILLFILLFSSFSDVYACFPSFPDRLKFNDNDKAFVGKVVKPTAQEGQYHSFSGEDVSYTKTGYVIEVQESIFPGGEEGKRYRVYHCAYATRCEWICQSRSRKYIEGDEVIVAGEYLRSKSGYEIQTGRYSDSGLIDTKHNANESKTSKLPLYKDYYSYYKLLAKLHKTPVEDRKKTLNNWKNMFHKSKQRKQTCSNLRLPHLLQH